jgi:Alginate lyase
MGDLPRLGTPGTTRSRCSWRPHVRSVLAGASAASLATFMLVACGGKSPENAQGRPALSAPPDHSYAGGCPSSTLPGPPHLYGIDPAVWTSDEQTARSDTSSDALVTLRADAKKAIDAGPWTVTASPTVGPGGPHQYVTLSRYWWPNKSTANGLPYVRHDGKTDPLVASYPDETFLDKTVDTVSTLAHAYSLLGDEQAADRAAVLLRTFFLDPGTAMAPDATYGQIVPGQPGMRGEGVLDTRVLIRVVDDLTLLQGSRAWTPADNAGMTQWLSSFLDWLQTSPDGQAAAAETNNHGTWYGAESASLALYLGRPQTARQVVDHYVADQEAKQISPDGSEPLELARTNAWDYSTFNLDAAMMLSLDARYVGVDLFDCTPDGGGSIAAAIAYLLPYATGAQPWSHQEIGELDLSEATFPVEMAATTFHDAPAAATLGRIPSGGQSEMDGLRPPRLGLLGHTA